LKLLLDTTYLLPAIGISVKGIPKEALIELIERGHKVFVSGISPFELSAKGAKYVVEGSLSSERIIRGIRAIVYDDTIATIPIYESKILAAAFKLRSVLNDFIDCLILSSAIVQCDALVTEDKDIKNLERTEEAKGLLTAVNPEFQIRTLSEALRS